MKKVLPSDDDVTHMIVHGAAGSGVETTLHTMAHIQQYITKGQPQVSTANPQIQNAMASSQAGQLA